MKTQPIRGLKDIARIKRMLSDDVKASCIFILGINTAFRASDLVALKIGDVANLKAGDSIEIKEKKTGKYRRVTVNGSAVLAIQKYLSTRCGASPEERLFVGRRGPHTVHHIRNLVKSWCFEAGLSRENYGSHTLRKTWGYHQRVTFNADIPTLMVAFAHATQKQTLDYLGIQEQEVVDLFMNEL